jgi:hypothetical protein
LNISHSDLNKLCSTGFDPALLIAFLGDGHIPGGSLGFLPQLRELVAEGVVRITLEVQRQG